MHAPDSASNPHAPVRTRAGEHGWGVVEIMVVMVIMTILATIAIISFSGAKGAVYAKEGIAAGTAYSDAIAKFQADHANMLPSAADMLGSTTVKPRGPKSLLNPNKPYISGVPDGVQGGRVAVKMTPNNTDCGAAPGQPSTPVGSANALVSYCPGTAPDYAVRVMYKLKKGDAWTQAKICWLGRTAASPRC